jgi:hypothetical protein
MFPVDMLPTLMFKEDITALETYSEPILLDVTFSKYPLRVDTAIVDALRVETPSVEYTIAKLTLLEVALTKYEFT